ncbi:MAG: Copper binding protein, plastocyanin/azurin family [Nitrosopumilales archaeon]|nr:MAG: Copper binding protein, plastocyanin/azurin family [Nitrosopumilales archaeon]
MSEVTQGHAYGIGIITVVIGLSIGLGYYQMFYLPELSLKPSVDEEILEPLKSTEIEMIVGSADPDQQDNFVPKLLNIQLGIDNHIVWTNVDDVAHTVTPDESTEDSYSGEFGSTGVIMPGETYEFTFTEPNEVPYHCEPHPWMTGTLIIAESRF